jgi:hypothetical protein
VRRSLALDADARDAWTRALCDRLRVDQRTRIAAALDNGDYRFALALVASVDRIARSVEATHDVCAEDLLYAIAHECSARLSDARRLSTRTGRRHGSRDFPLPPLVPQRAPVARSVQPTLPLGGATAAPESGPRAPEQRRAPWERSA